MNISRKPILKAIGQLVKQRRQTLMLSQEDLGGLAGLDRTYISGIERGVRNPSLTALVSLSTALQITTSELLQHLEFNIKENKENE